MTIMTPKNILKKSFMQFPSMFVDKILVPLIKENVQFVAQLQIFDVCNQLNKIKEGMFITREDPKKSRVIVIFEEFVMLLVNFPN